MRDMQLIILIMLFIASLSSITSAQDMSASYWYENGSMCLKNQSYEEAIISFNRSISEDLKYWDAWYGKGQALYHLKKYDDGLDLCNTVLNDRNGPQAKSRARFIELEGIISWDYQRTYNEPPIKTYDLCSGEIPEIYLSVEKKYDDALELDPELISAWNSKGIFLGNVCRWNESIACFEEALRIDPTVAEVWNNKGVTLDLMEKYNESLHCYDKAIELKPKLAVAWMNRAKILSFNMSLYSWSQSNASQAIELDPSLESESSQMTWNYIQAI